jgi:hypothetical protein
MPTVFRSGPYRFFFFSDEGNEPVHVHVEASGHYASPASQPPHDWARNCEAMIGYSVGCPARNRRGSGLSRTLCDVLGLYYSDPGFGPCLIACDKDGATGK